VADTGQTAATPCLVGTYADTAASIACLSCPDGQVSNESRTGCLTTFAGDINADDIVDLSDAIIAGQIMSGISLFATVNPGADVNGDYKIGLEEMIYILQDISEIR
jgi:hypothetical protein